MSPKIDPDHMTTAAEQPQRRRRKSDARESILNAAERLFGELGYGLFVAQRSRQCRVNKA